MAIIHLSPRDTSPFKQGRMNGRVPLTPGVRDSTAVRPESTHSVMVHRGGECSHVRAPGRSGSVPTLVPAAITISDLAAAIRALRLNGWKKSAGRCRSPKPRSSFQGQADAAGSNKETDECV